MFINLEIIDKRDLDFLPDLLKRPPSTQPDFWRHFEKHEQIGQLKKKLKTLALNPMRAVEDYDLKDTTQMRCEEFIWRGKPFGFYVRNFLSR